MAWCILLQFAFVASTCWRKVLVWAEVSDPCNLFWGVAFVPCIPFSSSLSLSTLMSTIKTLSRRTSSKKVRIRKRRFLRKRFEEEEKKNFLKIFFFLESIKARPRWPREKPENRFVRLWRFLLPLSWILLLLVTSSMLLWTPLVL